jgi:hypothetical protein
MSASVPANEIRIDGVREQGVHVLVATGSFRPVQRQIFPIADGRHQLNAEEIDQRKNRRILALGVGVQCVGLNIALILQQPVQDVNGFPDAARDEVLNRAM